MNKSELRELNDELIDLLTLLRDLINDKLDELDAVEDGEPDDDAADDDESTEVCEAED